MISDNSKNPLTKKEMVAYAVLFLLTAVSFCFVYDLWHTSQCSFAFLKGHFSDFYDYNASLGVGAIVYYPTIYVLFAIWNAPLYFLAGVDSVTVSNPFIMIYEKAFGFMFLILIYIMVYRIVKAMFGDKKKAWGAIFVQFTIPYFFLVSIAWGLYDSVHISFILLGIYLLMRKSRRNTLLALLCFSIAVSCKTFALFLILPVLFFHFKKIPQLIGALFSSLSIMMIQIVLYRHSPIFNETVLNPMSHFVGDLFSYGLNGTSFYLICLIWICIKAYQTTTEHENHIYYIWFAFASGALYIAMTHYNPSWVFVFMPFMAILITTVSLKERKLFYLLNLASAVGFIGNVVNRGHHYSEPTFAAGVWGHLVLDPSLYTPAAFVWLIEGTNYYTEAIFKADYVRFFVTIIAAILFYAVYALYPGRQSTTLLLDEPFMDAHERKFAVTCLLCGISLYIIPVISWAIMNSKWI